MRFVIATIFCLFLFLVGFSMVIGAGDVGTHIGRYSRDGYDGAIDMYNAAIEEASVSRDGGGTEQ